MCSAACWRSAVWSLFRYVPSTPVALIFLGVTPFLVKLFPADFQPDPESRLQGTLYGTVCMTLMLLTGVAGPLIDSFFLGGKLDRREIVATKAMCQIISHGLKLAYFGGIIEQAGSARSGARRARHRRRRWSAPRWPSASSK